jgi:hypothetical protein
VEVIVVLQHANERALDVRHKLCFADGACLTLVAWLQGPLVAGLNENPLHDPSPPRDCESTATLCRRRAHHYAFRHAQNLYFGTAAPGRSTRRRRCSTLIMGSARWR